MKEFPLLSAVKKWRTMKNKLHLNYFLAGVIALSLFSFAYVNLHAAYSRQAARTEQAKTPQPVILEDQNDQNRNVPVPDITILSRIVDIAQKVTRSNH